MALKRNPPQATKPPFLLREGLGLIRLHLDDINDLLVFLRPRAREVVLAAKNAVADEAIDLRGATKDELENVALRITDPDLTIWLQRKRCEVETTDDSEKAQALVVDIAALLRTRPDRVLWIWCKSALLATAGPFLFLIPFLHSLPLVREVNSTALQVLIVATIAFIGYGAPIGGIYYYARKAKGSTRIVPAMRRAIRDNSSNRNLIWATLIAALLSSLLTAVLTSLFR